MAQTSTATLEQIAKKSEYQDLLEKAEDSFEIYSVRPEDRSVFKAFFTLLQRKDPGTFAHSLRVGLLGAKVAEFMHMDPKALLYGGFNHDLGKLLQDPEVLTCTGTYTDNHRKQMKRHPIDTYRILRGIFEYSGWMGLKHHDNQDDPYPKKLPKQKIPFSRQSKVVMDFNTRLLSLVDFYDAASTRVNEKFGAKRKLTDEEVKAIILLKNTDIKYLIQELYRNGILGDGKGSLTEKQDMLYDSVWKDWSGKRTPKETRRFVTLACALEPMSYKTGCTTRGTDISKYLKLEYFIAGAINIGDTFEELAERVTEQKKQPEVLYDLAYKAQLDCSKNRAGGRINQGIIEILFPIVAAQSLTDHNYTLSVDDILNNTTELMKRTSKEDVNQLVRMKRLAYELCGDKYNDRSVPEYKEAKNIHEYYRMDLEKSENPTSIAHNNELCSGFPATREIYSTMLNSDSGLFQQKVVEAYNKARKGIHKEISPGLSADCIAAAIYLVLSSNPKERVIV